MLGLHHVDEVDDDDAAQVAQPQLARNGQGRFQVGLEHRVVEVARADEAAGVDVDGGQRLGLVDDQVAAGLQIHPSAQRLGDFLIDVEQIKNRALAPVVRQARRGGGHELLAEGQQGVELLARIDADRLRGLARQITQHALQQVQVFVQQAGRRLARGGFADARPGLAQVGDVLGQFGVGGVLGVGAQDEAAAAGALGRLGRQRLHPPAQLVAQRGGDLLRHAHVVVLRQEHQHAPRQTDLRRQPRALAADRVLDDLHHQRLALEHLLFDGFGRRAGAVGRQAVAIDGLLPQVGHVQEGRALQPDVDEGRLHARQHARHLAQVDVADQAALQRTLDVQLLHRAAFDHRHPGFLGRPVDENILLHFV